MPPLPFRTTGEVSQQGGTVLIEALPCSVWKLKSARQTSRGEFYEWTGQAHVSGAAAIIDKANRVLTVDGRRLRILDATKHDFIPHIELSLGEMRAAG